MLESPRSPIAALSWEIWLKNRKWAGAALGIIPFGYGLDWLRPGTMRPDNHNLAGALFSVLMVLLLVLVFGIFTYTEFNPEYGSTGFPRRLFVLPVSHSSLSLFRSVSALPASSWLISRRSTARGIPRES